MYSIGTNQQFLLIGCNFLVIHKIIPVDTLLEYFFITSKCLSGAFGLILFLFLLEIIHLPQHRLNQSLFGLYLDSNISTFEG